MKEISDELYHKLDKLGMLPNNVRKYNIGGSDYAAHFIQPWAIWIDHSLNPFDADIIKRVLRKKTGNDRCMDYRKIIHICQERIRQIEAVEESLKKEDGEPKHDGESHENPMDDFLKDINELNDCLKQMIYSMEVNNNNDNRETVEQPRYYGGINEYKYIIK